MTCQISPCVTDTDFSIESKVGDNILLLLQLSDNASVLLMPNYNIDILTLVLLCLYVSYHSYGYQDWTFKYFPHQTLSYKVSTLLWIAVRVLLKSMTYIFPFVATHLGKVFWTLIHFILLWKANRIQWKLRSCLHEIWFCPEMKLVLCHSFKLPKWI